ncbi:MAG: peroxiredoxin family protein [SAR202 cluster bacterium]|nr:peroxiredoxin family protein [SAR202 cluster bacterium]
MFCRDQLVELRESYDKIKKIDAEVIAISTEKPIDIKRTIEALGFQYPVLYDTASAVPRLYGVDQDGTAIPSTFVLDKSGKIRWTYIATEDHDQPSMAQIIEQLEAL